MQITTALPYRVRNAATQTSYHATFGQADEAAKGITGWGVVIIDKATGSHYIPVGLYRGNGSWEGND